jgi:hypothetical protein
LTFFSHPAGAAGVFAVLPLLALGAAAAAAIFILHSKSQLLHQKFILLDLCNIYLHCAMAEAYMVANTIAVKLNLAIIY